MKIQKDKIKPWPFFKFLKCYHEQEDLVFIRNIHGDEINHYGGYRSIWFCTKCDSTVYSDTLYHKGNISDGYHTFDELYHHRAVLFSVICNAYKQFAWKSKLHADGSMYDGMFIVGIDTPNGQATYHYNIDPYWNMFDVKELETAPEWDGHTANDAINRIGSLVNAPTYEGIINYLTTANTRPIGNPKCKYCAKGKKN